MKKINLNINGLQIKVSPKLTVLQTCLKHNIDVPSFCYHGELGFAGNCRMCLVEVSGAPKPIISCIFPVSEGLVVNTNSAAVRKARETVIEFLLLNHPLDCPICDQAGECDLQELSYNFGSSNSRSLGFFREAVDDVNLNYSSTQTQSLLDSITKKGLKSKVNVSEFEQVISPYMSRCILCTKCLRYERNISGVSVLGVFGRGSGSQIRVLDRGTFLNELSGNTIDLCPVGALTSKNYAFKGRPWDLINQSHIDVFDNYGSDIEIGYKNGNILRIAPKINNNLNSSWISDVIRYGYDGFLTPSTTANRLKNSSIFGLSERFKKKNTFLNFLIKKPLFSSKNFLKKPKNILTSIENPLSLFQISSLKFLALNFNQFKKPSCTSISADLLPDFLFKRLSLNKNKREVFILLNTDLRVTHPVLNSRLYQLSYNGLASLYKNGNYDFNNLKNANFVAINDLMFSNYFIKNKVSNSTKKIFLTKCTKKIFFEGGVTFLELFKSLVNFRRSVQKNFKFQYVPRYQSALNGLYLNISDDHFSLKKLKQFKTVFKNANVLSVPMQNPYSVFFNTFLVGNIYRSFFPAIQKSLSFFKSNKNISLFQKQGLFISYLFLNSEKSVVKTNHSFRFFERSDKKKKIIFYNKANLFSESDASSMTFFGKCSPFLRKTRQLKLRFRNNFGLIF